VSNCPNAQSAFLTKLNASGSLVYSTFLGHANETAVAVAVDSSGQAYVAGSTNDQCDSPNTTTCFPTTANAVLSGTVFNHTTSPSNFNQGSAFISVFDATGAKLLYSTLFGGNGAPTGNQHPTFGSGVAVDSSGYFYLVGTTQSNQLPVTTGAFQTTYNGNPTAGAGTSTRGFVAKFNPVNSGASLAYATYFGGFDKTVVSYQDVISGIAADSAGNAYLSGIASADFPATAGANNSIPCPSGSFCLNRGFLAKLNAAGSALVWATFVGTKTDPTLGAASTISPPRLDAKGNVYVSGVAGNNSQYPLVNPLQPANGFGGVYVTMYDPTGSAIRFSMVLYDPTANGGIFNSGMDVDSGQHLCGRLYDSTRSAHNHGLVSTCRERKLRWFHRQDQRSCDSAHAHNYAGGQRRRRSSADCAEHMGGNKGNGSRSGRRFARLAGLGFPRWSNAYEPGWRERYGKRQGRLRLLHQPNAVEHSHAARRYFGICTHTGHGQRSGERNFHGARTG
jgi:hypothetical protein